MPVGTGSSSKGAAAPIELQSTFIKDPFTLADGQPKEFLWACELSEATPEVMWNFDEEDDDLDYVNHTLCLRHAVLGKGAVKDERNLVEIETTDFAKKVVKVPLASLTAGRTDMCQLDINFSHEIPVTFRLIEGRGPVSLCGQHLAEIPPPADTEDEEEDYTEGDVTADTEEDEEAEDEEDEDEEEEETSAKASKKRKASSGAGKKTKRGKLDSAVSTEGTEDDDEDEDEDDEEDEEEEEEDEEEDEEESMEEEEEEESSPEKKKKKSTKAVKKPTPKALKAKMKAASGKARVTRTNKTCALM